MFSDAIHFFSAGDDGVIRGFHNSCLHRGRALRMNGGTVKQLKCPYHGFSWDLRGKLDSIPCEWDFKHLDKEANKLPEVRVGMPLEAVVPS